MELLPPIPDKLSSLPWISAGTSSLVFQLSESAVIKASLPTDQARQQLAVEQTIYARLGSSHPHITKFFHAELNYIVLECLLCPLRQRLLELQASGQVPSTQDALRWATQVAEGLHHVHFCGISQVDIGTYNVMLDWEGNAKLSDFAGSSVDGTEPTIAPGAHAESPSYPSHTPSIQSEMFALGSLLFEIETTRLPYHEKSDKEIGELFTASVFPNTSELLLGDVIRKCWTEEYIDVGDVLKDMKRIRRQTCNATRPAGPLGRLVQPEVRTVYSPWFYHRVALKRTNELICCSYVVPCLGVVVLAAIYLHQKHRS